MYEGAFVLYESVRENLMNVEKFFGSEKAWAFMKAILSFGFDGELPAEDNEVWAFGFASVIASIGAAKDRYETSVENGKKGGRPKIDREKVAELKNEGCTNQEIADELNCSLSSIEKINAENRKNQNNQEDLIIPDNEIDDTAAQSDREIKMMQQWREQKSAF